MPMIFLAIPAWARRTKLPQHIKFGYAKTGTVWKPGLLKIQRVGGILMNRMCQLTGSNNSASVLKDRLTLTKSEKYLETCRMVSGRRGLLGYARSFYAYKYARDCILIWLKPQHFLVAARLQ